MANIIIAVVLLALVGAAVAYMVREKKKGARCIGCPYGGNCPSRGNGHSGCGCQTDKK